MANKTIKTEKRNDDDTVINRVMIDFAATAVAIFAVHIVNSKYQEVVSFLAVYQGLLIALIASAAAAVVAGVVAFLGRKRKKLFPWAMTICAVSAVVCVGSLVLRLFWSSGAVFLYFAFSFFAILYLIYLIYQHEFFLISTVSAIAGLGFYGLSHLVGDGLRPSLILVLAIMLFCFALLAMLTAAAGRSNGQLNLGTRQFSIYQGRVSRIALYLTSVIWALCAILSLLIGPVFAYYCIFAAAAWWFLAACYYTIKLM